MPIIVTLERSLCGTEVPETLALCPFYPPPPQSKTQSKKQSEQQDQGKRSGLPTGLHVKSGRKRKR